MSLFSFTKKTNEELSIILEIGSGSIGGAIIKLSNKEQPEIYYSIRKQISLDNAISSENLNRQMIKVLNIVCENLQKDGLKHLDFIHDGSKKINNLHFVLSSPWIVSQTKTAFYKKELPFKVTDSLMKEIIQTQEDVVDKIAVEQFAQLNPNSIGIVFEKKIVQVKLNGYKITNPINKIAPTIDLAMVISVAPQSFLQTIEKEVSKYFNYSKPTYNSFTLASFSMLSDLYPEKEDYMFLDLSSEISEISLIRDGVLIGETSFPIGRNNFVRKIAAASNVSVEEAFSLLRSYHSNHLDQANIKLVEDSLDVSMQEWKSGLHQSLDILARSAYIPRTIFKITNDDFGIYFANKLRGETFSQLGFTNEPFKVVMLDSKVFNKHCKISKQTQTDSFMYLNTLFLNKIFNLK